MSSSKKFKAAVIGGSGYGAGEMLRRLLLHPNVEVAKVASIDLVGEPLWAAHPNLTGLTDLKFENISPKDAAEDCDIALLALPHKVTAAKVPQLIDLGVKIVDMSGDFRLRDAATYEKFYGVQHPHPELLGTFTYGLPEMNRDAIAKGQYTASPGCFATNTEVALLPLAKAGLLSGPIHVTAITGSSGSGAAPSAGTHHPVRSVTLRAYKPLVHQHTPEICQALGDAGANDVQLRFIPVSAPLTRGIFVMAFLEVDAAVSKEQLETLYDETFADCPFVRRPTTRLPEVAPVAGSNFAEVGFALGEAMNGKRTLTCFGAIDNLIKGGAGQAIQNMNIMLGVDEMASLRDPGSWP
ncbi:MAG: N-acetyl-gamma-glutamyl-phosphate reductase [Myxococcales bacterium]|nr:N-acetyl-gamma-glutamyl-phosphate reductase [Myxococcales bacterium]